MCSDLELKLVFSSNQLLNSIQSKKRNTPSGGVIQVNYIGNDKADHCQGSYCLNVQSN